MVLMMPTSGRLVRERMVCAVPSLNDLLPLGLLLFES